MSVGSSTGRVVVSNERIARVHRFRRLRFGLEFTADGCFARSPPNQPCPLDKFGKGRIGDFTAGGRALNWLKTTTPKMIRMTKNHGLNVRFNRCLQGARCVTRP
jgi:hypothetical protein